VSLEDQIRAMGDARAGEVSTPMWRDVSGGGRGHRLLAAAAIVLVIVGVIVVMSNSGGDAPRVDVDTADPDVDADQTPTSLTPTTVPTTTGVPTTNSAPTTTSASPGRTCATNPEPSAGFLDTATHIAFDRTPLDLDLDGIDDEVLIHEADDGTWSLIARLQGGWTNALDIGQPSLPGLALTPDGVPAGTDLDGDGGLEFFVTGYLADTAQLVSFNGCELVDKFLFDSPPESPGATFGVQLGIAAGSDLCTILCFTRVSCSDGVLTQEILVTDPPGSAPGGDVALGRGEIRLHEGTLELTELLAETGIPILDLPPNAPSAETTGVIDCLP
jgi:hypothetical protein